MNDIDDDAADELTLRYRRASAGDPSRPSHQTRAAISAQARIAMTYRTPRPADEAALAQLETSPAANDSRWNLRAVAGLAVVGLAGLLATVALHNTPGPEAPRTTVAAQLTPVAPAPFGKNDALSTEKRDTAARVRPLPAAASGGARSEEKSVSASGAAPDAFPGGANGPAGRAASPPASVSASPPQPREMPLTALTQTLRSAASDSTAHTGANAESAAPSSRIERAAVASGRNADTLVLPRTSRVDGELRLRGTILVLTAADQRHVVIAVDSNGDRAVDDVFLYLATQVVRPTPNMSWPGVIEYQRELGVRVSLPDIDEVFEFAVDSRFPAAQTNSRTRRFEQAESLEQYHAERYLLPNDFEALFKSASCMTDYDACLLSAGMTRVPRR